MGSLKPARLALVGVPVSSAAVYERPLSPDGAGWAVEDVIHEDFPTWVLFQFLKLVMLFHQGSKFIFCHCPSVMACWMPGAMPCGMTGLPFWSICPGP